MKPSLMIALLLAAAACGSKTDSNPAAATPTALSVSISPATDFLKVKATERFFLNAQLSTGTTEIVTATWSIDNQSVASVAADGTVTGAGVGTATITAEYRGLRATRTVRVLPDYAGRWAGTFFVTGCSVESGARPEWCDAVRGASFPARLDLVQTRDVVSGAWTLQEESNGTVTGTIDAVTGTLSLTGTFYQGSVVISISAWQSQTLDGETMIGTFTLTWSTGGTPVATTRVELRSFRRP